MGVTTMTEQRLQYTACGLDSIYLLDGFRFAEGKRGRVVKIEDQNGLHRAIGDFLIRQKRSLNGKELRFLRHELGLSQPKLAGLLGESEQSVARREKREKGWKRPTPQERLLRFMFEEQLGGNEPLVEFLRALADLDERENTDVEFKQLDGWQRAEERTAA